ncbi:pitrilysin family protein [Aminobacter sp. NyZ550]|uniref:M16 family metallopeptidase n=1 Tax=Aminobacter sp. NyZ550 TaxID=2979870 RepID=UPI0021D60F03|nr:pitrilysin family protein [Aminobacter sp. NyZ550]WAX94086.1 pitrilysin family protein [Aminobacter sp. NyZ550]
MTRLMAMRFKAPTFSTTRASAATLMLALVFLVLPAMVARAEVRIQEVKSDKGITAWLVEDYSVPIIAIKFLFDGGSTQDPQGKEGLANLMTGLFDEGAGDLDSDAFQIKLDKAGAEMGFNEGNDAVGGGMRMLAERQDDAFELLKLAVETPRFDQAPLDRIRAQIVNGIVANARDPETQAARKWAEAIYGTHPYARPDMGTEASLATITADDLRAFHKANFARENIHVAVVGAIDAETLKKRLDQVFGELPDKAELRPVERVEPRLGQAMHIEYPLPQTSLQLVYPGVPREAPDFLAAALMEHILGGGTFSSRLFDEVREKRGLAYSVSSALINQEHSSSLIIGTATRSDRAAETLGVIREVIRKMAEEGPTAAELDAAKKYMLGAYAINNLDSSGAIAGTLVDLQTDKLGIDYMQRRVELINAVTLDDVRAAARKLLSVDPAIMILGPKFGESKG